MSNLNLEPNIKNVDDFYEQLLSIHDGKSKENSDAINAKLILILANHIGDETVLTAALAAASKA